MTVQEILTWQPPNLIIAALVILVGYALKSILIFVPIMVMQIAAGHFFSRENAILINTLGLSIVMEVPYWTGRLGGSRQMEKLMRRYPKVAKLVNLQHDNEMAACFMLRACAVPPPDVVTMYLGASHVHFLTNVVGGVMGSFLCMVLTTLLGANIRNPSSPAFWQVIALNDVETNCRCVSTWVNEQTIREIYLKPFQMAIEEGGAMNVMNAFSRFGAVWSGGHYGLMTNVLRGEWGMKGFGLTDFSGNSMFAAYGITLKSFDVAQGVLAGTDSWDSSAVQWTEDLINLYQNDPDVCQAMREATHRVLYTVANSHAMNGFTAETQIVGVTPWWQTALYALCIVMGVLTVGSVWKLTKVIKKSKAVKA